jgi:hypothetical protein
MKYSVTLFAIFISLFSIANPPKQEYYELRVYELKTASQEKRLDDYLNNALVPALHRSGINKVGVFKQIGNDTAAVKKVYVLIPYKTLNELDVIDSKLSKDQTFNTASSDYTEAAHDNPVYSRFSKTVLKAFSGHPVLTSPKLTGPKKDRVYELRSYEGATEKLYRTKVKMFVDGDEIAIFDKLGFNPVFYGEVIAGSAMPNLMYMTSFENKQSRDEHWKAFGDDPDWNKLKSDKQYDNTVSHIDMIFLYPADYSDL